MKFPDSGGGSGPWEWWQPLRLRLEVRRRMRPMTPDTANRRRLIVSALYCASAAVLFHYVAFKEGAFSHKPEASDAALELMNEGKIIEMDNFKIRKVIDFASADFDDKIKRTNKPTTVLD